MHSIAYYTDQTEAMAALVYLKDEGIEAGLFQIIESGVLTFKLEVEEGDIELATVLLSRNQDIEDTPEPDLSQYSNTELEDIIVKSDEYAPSFMNQARTEIAKRGISNISELSQKQKEHIKEQLLTIQEGSHISNTWLILGYITAFLGGILGTGMGWFIEIGKTEGPDGKKYFSYNKTSRKHGKRMKWIGLIVIAAAVIWQFYLATA